MDHGCCDGEGAHTCGEGGETDQHTGACMGKMIPHSNWFGKWEGWILCNQWRPRVFKVSMLGSGRASRHWGCSWGEGRENSLWYTAGNQQSEECLGHIMRRLFAFFGVPGRQQSWKDPFRNKGPGRGHFPPLSLSISTEPSVGISRAPTFTT